MGVRVAALVLLAAVACGGATEAGPMRIDVPDGWRVTRRSSESVQFADGRSGPADRRGAASVVFDVYFSTEHTPASYRQLLREEAESWSERTRTVGGSGAVVYTYRGGSFGGVQEAVLVPARGVLFVYRAARKDDPDAFERRLREFHNALLSVEFIDDAEA